MLGSISITVEYDEGLGMITGTGSEPCIMSEGSTFEWLFNNIHSSHPEIFKKYKPGELGFLLNGKPIDRPVVVLMDGDVVKFYVILSPE